MIYPQLVGEPNFVLIGVSAVFGLLIIIIVYYIVTNKNKTVKDGSNRIYPQNNSSGSSEKAVIIGTGCTDVNDCRDKPHLFQKKPTDASGMPIPNNNASSTPTVVNIPTLPINTVSNPNIKQVFNIKENIYTLEDAPAVCGAVGSTIASMDQLIDAHKKGADWCNVGWTKDGLAAYPIQYSTWRTLQDNNPGKRNICGSPGINLSRNDPNLLYGVNCYGIKPEPKGGEIVKQVITSDKQVALNAKISEFQKNLNAINLAPFNVDKWSE
jgi:hypothetical protein